MKQRKNLVFYSIFSVLSVVLFASVYLNFLLPDTTKAALSGANADLGKYWNSNHDASVWTDDTADANDSDSTESTPDGFASDVEWPMNDGSHGYFGHETLQFNKLHIKVDTTSWDGYPSDHGFEYWNGTSWTTLTTTNDTGAFQTTGIHTFSFTPPGDWAKTSVNGESSSYYYIRFTCNDGCQGIDVSQISLTTVGGNSAPSASFQFTPSQATDGTVSLNLSLSDEDSDPLKLKFEARSGDCSVYSGQSTTTMAFSFSKPEGAVLDNSDTDGYQVQNIDLSKLFDGALNIVWNASTDYPTAEGQYCIYVTPNDGTTDGDVASSTVALDFVAPTKPGALTVNSVTTNSVTFNLPSTTSSDANFSEYEIHYKEGSSGVTWFDNSFSGDTNLNDVNFNGALTTVGDELATNTQYVANIWAGDTAFNTASSTSEVSWYTLAATPGKPTVDSPTASSVDITIDAATNPTNTTFAIYNVTDGNYIAADGSSSGSAVYQTTSTWSNVTATGLSPNTAYQFEVIAQNGSGTKTASSTDSTAVYTAANIPTSGSATAVSGSQITVSWNANSNPSGTAYYVEDANNSSRKSGWITDTSYTFSNLEAGTEYSFKVKARNGDAVSTSYLTGITASTPGGGGGAPVVVAPPTFAVPTPQVSDTTADSDTNTDTQSETVVPVTPTRVTADPAQTNQPIPGTSHSIGSVLSVTPQRATIIIHSEPVVITLDKGMSKDVDTDEDGIADFRAEYIGLDENEKPIFEFTNLVNEAEAENPVVINSGAYVTDKQTVSLTFNVSDADTVAVSNSKDFAGASFVPFTSPMTWQLSSGAGKKIVYVRFRTASGGVADSFDTIIYNPSEKSNFEQGNDGDEATKTCPLTPGKVYRSENNPTVYKVIDKSIDQLTGDIRCSKKYFGSVETYFSHYDSWNEVTFVQSETLDAVPKDEVPFMVRGTKYVPKSGTLVKSVSSPEVYVIINNKKHWITSMDVLEKMNYQKDWIEDVSEYVLALYEDGEPIENADTYPGGTALKQKDQPQVYILKSYPGEEGLTKKLVPDTKTLQALGYRVDRVVEVDELSEYQQGDAFPQAQH